MLCFFYKKNFGRIGETKEISWHVGEELPDLEGKEVVEIQADCDELDYINRLFTNLPQSKNRVVRWFGDHAKFIAHNLR